MKAKKAVPAVAVPAVAVPAVKKPAASKKAALAAATVAAPAAATTQPAPRRVGATAIVAISAAVVLVVAIFVIIACLVMRPSSDGKPATAPIVVTATNAPNQTTVVLQKQNSVLQQQNEAPQKQVAEALTAAKLATEAANHASTMASKPQQVVAVPADKPNAVVMQALSHTGSSADTIVSITTGQPAVILALQRAAKAQRDRESQLRVQIVPMQRHSRFELDQAKEKEAQLKDLVKHLRHEIMGAESAKANRKNCLLSGSASITILRVWRTDIRRFEGQISELGVQLTQAESELQIATAEVASLSRSVY